VVAEAGSIFVQTAASPSTEALFGRPNKRHNYYIG